MLLSNPTQDIGQWQVLESADGGKLVMTPGANYLVHRDACTCGKHYPCEHIRTLFPPMAVETHTPRALPSTVDPLAPVPRYRPQGTYTVTVPARELQYATRRTYTLGWLLLWLWRLHATIIAFCLRVVSYGCLTVADTLDKEHKWAKLYRQ